MSVLSPSEQTQNYRVEPLPSKFKGSDLRMLVSSEDAYLSPLAVIALIDMNAFFAQCEQIRLNCTLDDPVVCCQWQSLIAVSYAARRFGIGRMDTLQSARQKCPDVIVGHAAVFRKGESHWKYLDGPPDQSIHKVSLDPYRRESRKIFKVLSRECDKVMKASVDECYLDLGRMVYRRLLELFPYLESIEPGEQLPQIPQDLPSSIYWQGKTYLTEEEKHEKNNEVYGLQKEKDTPAEAEEKPVVSDWDDVVMMIGSQILLHLREVVYKELKYTTSGGLATTKTMAKLAGDFIKPDNQTIVRPRAINSFLNNFELTDITQMGGQTGKRVLQKLESPPGTNSIAYIRENWSLDQMQKELSDEPGLAERVYEMCRGEHKQEIKQRTVIKSMMARKNFQPKNPVNTIQDCVDWIKVFSGDLKGRLIEMDDENLNLSMSQKSAGEKEVIFRPRTVSLQLLTTGYSRSSKQTPIPVIKDLNKFQTVLESIAFRLLCELLENFKSSDKETKYKAIKQSDEHLDRIGTPTFANMSLVVSNFVKTSDSNLIDSYGSNKGQKSTHEDMKRLFDEIKVPEAKAEEPKPKITRTNSYVKKLFEDFQSEQQIAPFQSEPAKPKVEFKEDKSYVSKMFEDYNTSKMIERAVSSSPVHKSQKKEREKSVSPTPARTTKRESKLLQSLIKDRKCPLCEEPVEDVFEHNDYHLALDLSIKLNGDANQASRDHGRKRDSVQSRLPFAKSERK